MGWIVLNNSAGRAMRRGTADVAARDVLDCSGGFAAGDTVYITFRGIDGGQYAVAIGTAACDENAIRRVLGASPATVIVRAQDVLLLWP